MHFEILVEGQTELTALSILMPKIVGEYNSPHSWKIHKHRGVGRIPDDPSLAPNARDATLLHQLPAKLRAYAKNSISNYIVIVLLDLDDKDFDDFLQNLNSLHHYCEGDFKAHFVFAVEELEAWYLGDKDALTAFNPNLSSGVLDSYVQDSICRTWELLAKAEDPSFSNRKKRSQYSLDKKKEWSKKIPPYMNVSINMSPSFNVFKNLIYGFIS